MTDNFPGSLNHNFLIQPFNSILTAKPSGFSHVDDAADAIALLHRVKCLVDVLQCLAVGDEFVNLELAVHVIRD